MPFSHQLRLCLYQPDIPQNTGAMMRLAACLGASLEIIEPCGFILDDRRVKRAAMDYTEHLTYQRHTNWAEFAQNTAPARHLLITNQDPTGNIWDFKFNPTDCLIVGRESAGFPIDFIQNFEHRLIIPMSPDVRSLNVATAAAIALGEAVRQNN